MVRMQGGWGRSASSWWREVANIRDGVGDEGEGWFARMVSRRVGDGENTLFWFDRWAGNVPLCQRFSRLFNLAENKLASVAFMFSLGWEEGVELGSGGGGCGCGRMRC